MARFIKNSKNILKNWQIFEKTTSLDSHYNILSKGNFHLDIKFINDNNNMKKIQNFQKFYANLSLNINQGHGCKKPDECYVSTETKTIFIIEKKYQNKSGSTCEKIQTPDYKLWYFTKLLPDYKVIYIYTLSDWFKLNTLSELEYLEERKIPVFWGNNSNYKDKLTQFIINNLKK